MKGRTSERDAPLGPPLEDGLYSAARGSRTGPRGAAGKTAGGDEPFAVLLADDIILAEPSCLTQLLEVHHKTGETTVALMQVARERSRPTVLRGAIASRN